MYRRQHCHLIRIRAARRARLAAVICAGLAVAAVGAPLPASAAALWHARVFSVSYDATGTVSYLAEGLNGDSGCHMSVSEGLRYGFDQLWTIKVGFQSNGKGGYNTKVESITHVSGPQVAGLGSGASTLTGKQTAVSGQECQDVTIVNDTGSFKCTSTALTLTAFNLPEMGISRAGGNLVILGRAFIDGHLTYTGQDTIPSDTQLGLKKGCGDYNADITYGSDLVPGIYATAKASLAAKRLFGLARKASISLKVSLGQNTEFPRLTTCDATFGSPNSCVIHSQSLTGTFKLIRVR